MGDDREWEDLLERYVSGTCSAADEMAVRRGLAERREAPAAIDALRAVRAAEAADPSHLGAELSAGEAGDLDAAVRRLEARLLARGNAPGAQPRLQTPLPFGAKHSWRIAWIGGATAAMAAAIAGVWIAHQAGNGAVPAPSTYRTYATTRGQRAQVRLLDGTDVVLNVDSRIRIPATFGIRGRDVEVTGEAYFRVTHDTARPFVVRTPAGATRDVGTAFDVRAYPADRTEQVAVVEGAVDVDLGATRKRPLRAGDVASLAADGTVLVTKPADVTRAVAWTHGTLVFDDTPFADVLRAVGRWYDLDVRLTDSSLAALPVTGSYGDEPIAHVLTSITAAVGARYEWQGRTVTVTAASGRAPARADADAGRSHDM